MATYEGTVKVLDGTSVLMEAPARIWNTDESSAGGWRGLMEVPSELAAQLPDEIFLQLRFDITGRAVLGERQAGAGIFAVSTTITFIGCEPAPFSDDGLPPTPGSIYSPEPFDDDAGDTEADDEPPPAQ